MINIANLAEPDFKKEKITEYQTANDICKQLQRAEYNSRAFSKKLAPFFKKNSDYETCQFVWAWMVKNIDYEAEPKHDQNAKTIARFIVDGYGDCKHYATMAVGVLNACGIPTAFYLVGQETDKLTGKPIKKPNHIYAFSVVNGKQVIIDPCRKNKFDDECKYFYKWSCQPIKKNEMALNYLSGDIGQTVINDLIYKTEIPPITSGTKEGMTPYLDGDSLNLMKAIAMNTYSLPAGKIYLDVPNGNAKSGQYFLVVNGKRVDYSLIPAGGKQKWIQRTGQTALFMTPAAAKQIADAWLKQNGDKGVWNKVRDAVQQVENVIKKAVATVTNSAARAAFLGATEVNAGNLAVKMLRTYKVAPDEVKSTWEKMGGDYSVLKKAIARGANVAISGDDNGGMPDANGSAKGDGDNTAATVMAVFKQALPYLKMFLALFKKHGTGGDAKEQKAFQSAIDTSTAALAADGNIPKTTVDMPENKEVGLILSKQPDSTAASFFSPLGLFFKTPLLLSLMQVQNPLISFLFAFVSLYCFVGLVVFPFYQWNWLNLREFVTPFIELPKKLFYGTIKKIC